MLRHRAAMAVVVVLTALVSTTMFGHAAPAAPDQSSGEAAIYVVSFTGGPDAAVGTIEAVGGEVVDVNEELSIALVSTDSATFLTEVQAQDGVTGAARNHSVGTTRPDLPHRWAEESLPAIPGSADESTRVTEDPTAPVPDGRRDEPLIDRQWGMTMIGATANGAHRRERGWGVDVGIIDTGIDATHPDIASNFDAARSRNFTMDIPSLDGPCEVPTCIDPNNVDDHGHGTHVAGIVAADDNQFGVGGVAPDVRLVNLRAGQDTGYFFLYETAAALTEAGNLGLDVVNMSFSSDPWYYYCDSREDYISGEVSDAEIAEQALIRQVLLAAVAYANDHGVTLVGSAGNFHLDLTAPQRTDLLSPNYPVGVARPRIITNDCLTLPNEAPGIIQVSAVGPSTTKSDYSNYGSPNIEVSAPGGWTRDFVGTPNFNQPTNQVLSSYPLDVAIENGRADQNGNPTDNRSVKYCDSRGRCGFYTYLQGTSMAAPHTTGVVALIIGEHGRVGLRGKSLDPDTVLEILRSTATDHPCPPGGVEDYTDEGRPPDWNAVCVGDSADNGLYGEGIVNAAAAVRYS